MRKFLRLQRRNRSENNEIKYNKYEGRKLKSSHRDAIAGTAPQERYTWADSEPAGVPSPPKEGWKWFCKSSPYRRL